MAALSNNKCFITAVEKNKIRCERLKFNLEKQGVKNYNVMQEDARNLSDFFKFDKILLDVPCSGSGTKTVFSKDFSEDLIERSTKFQKQLLEKALKLVNVGSEIVYSTCSILKEENEEILENFTQKIEILETRKVLPNKEFEGFFIAKIKKIKNF